MIQQLIRRLVPGNGNLQWRRLRKLTRKQQEFDRLRTHIKGFVGGRGVGKTEVGAHYILKHCRPGDPVLVVSPDYNVIQDTTWPTFQRVAEQTGQWIHGVKSPTPRAWFRPLGGGDPCLVVFRSAEKPDKLRGGSWALIWYDEASIMCHEAFTYSIPALRWRGQEGTILITMTPKGVNNWTFSLFFQEIDEGEREILDDEEDNLDLLDDPSRYRQINGRWYRQRENTGIVQAHSRENPFLPATYEHDIGMHLSKALQQQELAGEFIELAGLYFQRHWFEIVDAVPRVAQRIRYWDRASTHGGGCFSAGVLMARTDNGLFWIEDVQRGQWSYEERNHEIVRIARQDALEYGNTVQIWGEQEGGSAGKEVSQQFVKMLAGYPVHVDIVTGKGTRVLDGIELPHKPKLIRAQGMIAQAEAGNVKLKRAKWNSDFLDECTSFGQSDIMDQCVAEGTLITTHRGDVPIEQIQPSDFVLTRSGFYPIVQWGYTNPAADTLQIVLESGQSLIATANHPLFTTERGWRWLGRLETGETLLTATEKCLSLTESSGGDTQMPKSETIGCISAATSEREFISCIDTYGRDSTARFPRTPRYITPMGIRSTTPSKTWSALPRENTDAFTLPWGTSAPPRLSPTSPVFATRPKRGMLRQKATSGINNTERRFSRHESRSSKSVIAVGKSSSDSRTPGGHFVVLHVETETATFDDRAILFAPASGVARNLLPTENAASFVLSRARIQTIGPSGVRPVYNLTVNGPHEYFANGILVKNCDASFGAFNKLCRMWTTDPGYTGRIETVADGERFGVHLDKVGNQTGHRR